MIYKPRFYSATLMVLVFDLLLIGLVALYAVFTALSSYSGKCPSLMDGPSSNCSLIGAVFDEIVYLILFLLLVYWWIVLPVIIVPLVFGISLDIFRILKKKNQ